MRKVCSSRFRLGVLKFGDIGGLGGKVWPPRLLVYADRTSSLDYLFQIAVEMKKLGIPWESDIKPTLPKNSLRGQ